MIEPFLRVVLIILFFNTLSNGQIPLKDANNPSLAVTHFINLLQGTSKEREQAFTYIDHYWRDDFSIMAVELFYLMNDPGVSSRLYSIMSRKTKKDFGFDFDAWYEWIWSNPETNVYDYPDFKAYLHKFIDPKFETYFAGRYDSKIRLDEVRWGGVKQDGIPPLRSPIMINAEEATYLKNDHVVFGIEVNGDIRAYPKRILAWHEMFVDEVGGMSVCGVYCTLCGTVILYETEIDGKNYELGTSGFLYRSNKLMYDKATQSLWNTVWGEPVIGPLKDRGIQLKHRSVVTTTWGEWKRRHPGTKVLSLETGYRRNYGEGVAYKDYFSTDDLMFNVPFNDARLKNKDEVLALRLPEHPDEQLAISTHFLTKHPVFHERIDSVRFVILTDVTGGNRVYAAEEVIFLSYDGREQVMDATGRRWTLFEDRLEDAEGNRLQRLPYHRAFWFGWHAAYPDTRLIK